MNIFESEVKIPTHGEWLDIPGSPFQIATFGYDRVGDFHIRIAPRWRNHWTAWLDSNDWHGPDALS